LASARQLRLCGAEGRPGTHGILRRAQTHSGAVDQKHLQTLAFLGSCTGGGDPGVPSVSAGTDALPDCCRRNARDLQAFLEAADGIRTHDLLHGKQDAGLGAARNIPANRPLLPRERVPPMSSFHRGITGVSGLKPDWC
jgi:hypothetical protein